MASRGGHFDIRGLLRHDDVCGNAVHGRRIGDGLGMVSARIGDYAGGTDGFIEVADRVEGAANLEGADRLETLRLDPQRPIAVRPAGRDQGCAQDVGPNQFRGGADLVDGYQLHDSSLPDAASVTVEYWYFSSGSQLSSPRTDADLSAWTWNSLPRLKNGTTLNHRRS